MKEERTLVDESLIMLHVEANCNLIVGSKGRK